MLFVFDWDGTLCDSTDKIVLCMQKAAAKIGLEQKTADQVRNIIGLGLPEAIRHLYPSIDAAAVSALRSAYSEVYAIEDKVSSQLFPGVLESLHKIRASGFKLAVATGKSRRGLDRVLRNLGLANFFDATRCADETESKPHPKMLNELLLELGSHARDAFMVGDTEYDMEMAMRAEVPCIAVSYGAHALPRLLPYRPVKCLDEFAQIQALL